MELPLLKNVPIKTIPVNGLKWKPLETPEIGNIRLLQPKISSSSFRSSEFSMPSMGELILPPEPVLYEVPSNFSKPSSKSFEYVPAYPVEETEEREVKEPRWISQKSSRSDVLPSPKRKSSKSPVRKSPTKSPVRKSSKSASPKRKSSPCRDEKGRFEKCYRERSKSPCRDEKGRFEVCPVQKKSLSSRSSSKKSRKSEPHKKTSKPVRRSKRLAEKRR